MPGPDDHGVASPLVSVDGTLRSLVGERDGRGTPALRASERYLVRGEIARGGMGAILDGLDPMIRRDLVIKVLRSDLADSAEAVARFVEEAQIQGQLEHPSICPVHELGVDGDGRPFFTMKKVNGRSLQQILDAQVADPGSGPPLPALLDMFVKICDAVAFAHSRGVVHRDLKPDNVMIGEFGEVLVLDWGIAKVLHGPAGKPGTVAIATRWPHETLQGRVLGTPNYMPPEQARGEVEGIDERSDIYALGGVLYAILTLTPPIEGSSLVEILPQVLAGNVPSPTRRAPSRRIPPDLESATMKALSANPDDRYPSVAALRADVLAYLAGRTLQAAKYNWLEVAGKWVKRNHVFARTAASAGALLIFGALFYLVQVTRARGTAEERLGDALVAEAEAVGLAGRWVDARKLYQGAEAVKRRTKAASRAIELGLLDTYHHAPPPLVTIAARGVEIGDPGAIGLSPDGKLAVTATAGGISIWDLSTGRRWRRLGEGDPPVSAIALSPDGGTILAGSKDGSVALWDVASGRRIRRLAGGLPVRTVALSAGAVAVVGARNRLDVWDLGSGRIVRTLPDNDATAVAVSTDGRIAVSARGSFLTTYDLRTGEQVRGLDHHSSIKAVALTGDGQLATAGTHEGALWFEETASGHAEVQTPIHRGGVSALAFSADGRVALSGGKDGSLQVWDVLTHKQVLAFTAHAGAVLGVRLSRDGSMGISTGEDGTLRVWRTVLDRSAGVVGDRRGPVWAAAVSPDGRLILTGEEGHAALIDLATARPLQVGLEQEGVLVAAFSPDGGVAAWGAAWHDPGVLHLWDVHDGHEFPSVPIFGRIPVHVAFAADGRSVLVPGPLATVKSFDVDSGRETGSWRPHHGEVTGLAVAPDGRLAVSGSGDGELALWEVASGRVVRAWPAHTSAVSNVVFARDGQLVVSAGEDGVIAAWRISDGVRLWLSGHPGAGGAAILADQTVLSAGMDGYLRVWDHGRQLHAFPTVGGHRAYNLALSSDGQLAVLGTFGAKGGAIGLYDFQLPAVYRDFESRLARARAVLDAHPDDADGLAEWGHWFAFRGVSGWATALLERARTGGAAVSALELGRAYWQDGELGPAERELRQALARAEAPAWYLNRCLAAIARAREPPAPPLTGPADSKVERLSVADPVGGRRWSVQRRLRVGDPAFENDPHVVTRLDPRLEGLDWIRPSVESKFFPGTPLARLTLRKAATLYVVSDVVSTPSWLQRPWEPTDLVAWLGKGSDAHAHRVFARDFPAGPVELGPSGSYYGNPYLVLVK